MGVSPGFHADHDHTTVTAPTHYENPGMIGVGSGAHVDQEIIGIGSGAHVDNGDGGVVGIQGAA